MPAPADQLHDRLQSSFGADYTLGRELGGGGMSRVFLATETRLGRDVVVKVLDPAVASRLSTERFAREVQLAARLQHPHVVPVLSAGETDGMPFYTMPFVRGESLRDRLARGPVGVGEGVRVLAGVARALSYAHRNAVVHRDIKPDNVLLPDGIAVVTDFGIAKAIAVAAGSAGEPVRSLDAGAPALTQLGMAVGTPAYVAPEQASGDPDTDHRADIYAWGVLAYELLTGSAPFAGRAPHATILAHFTETPPPLETRRPDVPAALAALVARCLAKQPGQRPQSADELLAVLEGDAVAGNVSGISPAVAAPAPELPSVAVLPFTSLSVDPDAELFADGVTDEVIAALSQLGTLRVAGSVSSFAFKGRRAALAEVASQLRVANVVDGSVRRAGSRVRITVQLVSAADGFQLWSERFDRELLDVFEVQDEIARAVASALRAKLLTPPHSLAAIARHRPTESVEAYELYLRGRHLWTSRITGAAAALAHFERATTLDPRFAHAHAGIADAYLAGGVYGVFPPRVAMAPSLAAAERALALGPDLAESQASRGGIAFFFEHDVPRARRHLERALVLNPGYIPAMQWLGTLHLGQRNDAEVRRLAARALEVEPLSAGPHALFGLLLAYTGAVEEGEALVRRAAELDPAHLLVDFMLAFMLARRGRVDEGIAASERFHVATRGSPLATAARAVVYAVAGRHGAAERDVGALLARGAEFPISHTLVAVACVQLGDHERAYAQLDAALASPDVSLQYVGVDPWLAPLRGEPRFEAILRRLGLPPSER